MVVPTLQDLIASAGQLPTFGGNNLAGLYRLAGWRAGIWVRRDSWGRTVALFKTLDGISQGKLAGPVPYYKVKEARGDIYNLETGEMLEENAVLPCVGCWQWSWVGVPQDLFDLGPEAVFQSTLSQSTLKQQERKRRKAEEAKEALGPLVRLTQDTYPHREALKAMGIAFADRGWLVPVSRLDEVLALLGSSRARDEANGQLVSSRPS